MNCAYQSPINLKKNDCILKKIFLELEGSNYHSMYDPETKNFNVKNNIILTIDKKIYQLVEYHFHKPGEHALNGHFSTAEVHYVFEEITNENRPHQGMDVCGGKIPDDAGKLLVIGHLIDILPSQNDNIVKKLEKFPILLPNNFFMYDGSLTTPPFNLPIKWIVSDKILCKDLGDISSIAKHSRPLQPNDGRIILYSKNVCRC